MVECAEYLPYVFFYSKQYGLQYVFDLKPYGVDIYGLKIAFC